jgi:hypothetical protein
VEETNGTNCRREYCELPQWAYWIKRIMLGFAPEEVNNGEKPGNLKQEVKYGQIVPAAFCKHDKEFSDNKNEGNFLTS